LNVSQFRATALQQQAHCFNSNNIITNHNPLRKSTDKLYIRVAQVEIEVSSRILSQSIFGSSTCRCLGCYERDMETQPLPLTTTTYLQSRSPLLVSPSGSPTERPIHSTPIVMALHVVLLVSLCAWINLHCWYAFCARLNADPLLRHIGRYQPFVCRVELHRESSLH
jgi:hypothetical protein